MMIKSNSFDEAILTPAMIAEIKEIPYLKNSIYKSLDIEKTLLFFKKRYVNQLKHHLDITQHTSMDCASGFGWFSFMYVLAGGKFATAVDVDKERLEAAEEIARILSISSKMNFIHSPLEKIPVEDKSVDIFVCIETLEHVGKENIKNSLQSIARISKKAIIITTPNKLFPSLAHDTRIPLIHWLPAKYRRPISRMFGRLHKDDGNAFVSAFDLKVLGSDFVPVAKCLTFPDFEEYTKSFPFYQPYGATESERWVTKPSFAKRQYYKIASGLLGKNAYWIMPSLTNIFINKRLVT